MTAGGEIAQWIASLSVKAAVQVRAQHDPLVSETWNSISVLLTCSHQCWGGEIAQSLTSLSIKRRSGFTPSAICLL